jgi:hypothetical protein
MRWAVITKSYWPITKKKKVASFGIRRADKSLLYFIALPSEKTAGRRRETARAKVRQAVAQCRARAEHQYHHDGKVLFD